MVDKTQELMSSKRFKSCESKEKIVQLPQPDQQENSHPIESESKPFSLELQVASFAFHKLHIKTRPHQKTMDHWQGTVWTEQR